jgi:hypothetical protein
MPDHHFGSICFMFGEMSKIRTLKFCSEFQQKLLRIFFFLKKIKVKPLTPAAEIGLSLRSCLCRLFIEASGTARAVAGRFIAVAP